MTEATHSVTTFDFDSGMTMADRIDDGVTGAMDPNLSDFFRRGGKLLQYHSWSAPSISPLNSINYYNSVLDSMGEPANVRDSYQLLMVPGMDHCGGGDGLNTFDSVGAERTGFLVTDLDDHTSTQRRFGQWQD